MHDQKPEGRSGWRNWLYVVIFRADTAPGKAFDVVLILTILMSVAAVMLESVESLRQAYGEPLRLAEWAFTILFTIEYALRLVAAPSAGRYARSFFGLVDLLAIIPTYLSVLVAGTQYLLVVRLLRILRIFRILKLAEYLTEANTLMMALHASRRKITVFIFTVLTLVVIAGSLMYFVEGAENGFTSIPRSVYWAVVTLTTVGYGDIAPQTNLGQALAMIIMLLGYGIIAVPTGIVTVELSRADAQRSAGAGGSADARRCPGCGADGHVPDARYCRRCGTALE